METNRTIEELIAVLESAVAVSVIEDRIVTVEVADFGTAQGLLEEMDYEVDSVDTDAGREVWGWTESTPDGEMDWRLLLVKCN